MCTRELLGTNVVSNRVFKIDMTVSMHGVNVVMEIETASGVKVLVNGAETGKLLAFDRSISVVELTREEALCLAHALAREKQVKLSQAIRQLMESGYLNQPRSFGDIREKLRADGLRVKSPSLHVLVTNLAERGQLIRKGTRRAYVYTLATSASVT